MALKIVTISDGFESATVPSIVVPSVLSNSTYYATISSLDLVNGYLTIPVEPTAPTEVQLIWNGIGQFYTQDFTVSGSSLFFQSRLSPLLELGDEITIIYK
jgi:hypothetical protein